MNEILGRETERKMNKKRRADNGELSPENTDTYKLWREKEAWERAIIEGEGKAKECYIQVKGKAVFQERGSIQLVYLDNGVQYRQRNVH